MPIVNFNLLYFDFIKQFNVAKITVAKRIFKVETMFRSLSELRYKNPFDNVSFRSRSVYNIEVFHIKIRF